MQEDVRAAAAVDKFALVPELKRDPLRIEVGAVGNRQEPLAEIVQRVSGEL